MTSPANRARRLCSLHQVTDTPRSVAGRGQGPEADVAEGDRLTAVQLDVHRGRVGMCRWACRSC